MKVGDRVSWLTVKTRNRSQGIVKAIMGDRVRVQLPGTAGHLVHVPIERLEVAP